MMTICFLHNRFIWYRIPLFQILSKNYDIKFIFTHEKNYVNTNEIKYLILKNYFGFAFGLFNEITKRNYDLFIIGCCSNLQELLETLFSIFIMKIMRKPVIIWSEQWRYPKKFHKKLGIPIFKFIANASDAYIVPGKKHEEFAVKLGCDPEKIFIALNTSNLSDNNIKFNKSMDKQIVLFVGRLIKIKGVDVLIKAFSKLKTEKNDLMLFIVGEGDEKKNLIELANKLKIKDIKFKGWIENKDLPYYYANSDLFVLPSRDTDASGLVLFEAMHYGNPVIATDAVGSAYDLINDGENGFIVPVENIDALYKSMKFILQTEETQNNMAKKSKQIIESNNYENMFNKFNEAILYVK